MAKIQTNQNYLNDDYKWRQRTLKKIYIIKVFQFQLIQSIRQSWIQPIQYLKSDHTTCWRKRRCKSSKKIRNPISESNELVNIRFNKFKYIIHPQFMKHRGTMCMSEIWSQKMKKEFINVTQENLLDAKKIGLFGQDYTSLYRPEKLENEAKIVLKMNDLRIGIEVKAQTIDNLIKNLKSKVPEEVLDQFENELTQHIHQVQIANTEQTQQDIKFRAQRDSQFLPFRMKTNRFNSRKRLESIEMESFKGKIIGSESSIQIMEKTSQQDRRFSQLGQLDFIAKNHQLPLNKRQKHLQTCVENLISKCNTELVDDYKVQQRIDYMLNLEQETRKQKQKLKMQQIFQEKISHIQTKLAERKQPYSIS